MLLTLRAGMSVSPPVPFLNRAQLYGNRGNGQQQSAQAWQGSRTGRVFRSINSGTSCQLYGFADVLLCRHVCTVQSAVAK